MPDQIDRLKASLTDRYAIDREIGAGGMATVYLAEDVRHRRKVAIKVLRPELAETLGPKRFFQEIEVAAQLQHPNILPLLDSGNAAGFLYYVMPFVEGPTLRERLANQGELPVHDAIKILSEVVDALAEAHEKGIVHRDVKPDNVMLAGRHAVVTDFGVAKAIGEATGRHALTTAGVALGTPTYMAPEQAAAEPNIDHRVDIYAVGVLGYEMLAGRPPFSGGTAQSILAAHMTEDPRPLRTGRPSIPASLEQVILKCLEKRAADRWQSAEELLQHLEPFKTPSGGVTPTDTRPIKRVRVKRRVALPVGAGVVAVAAVAFLTMNRAPTPMTFGLTTQLTLDPGLEIDPSFSPDGRMVAYAAGIAGNMRIYVKGITGGAPIHVSGDQEGDHRLPRWSSDGSQLVFHARGALYVVPPLGGAPRLVARRPASGGLAYPTWSPDGSQLAYVSGELGIGDSIAVYVRNVNGGEAREVGMGLELHTLSWSPDGKWIAAVSGNASYAYSPMAFGNLGPTAIVLFPADGGDAIELTDRRSMHMSPTWTPDSRSVLVVSTRDGGRDIYRIPINARGRRSGSIERLTTGIGAGMIGLSRDGTQLAYTTSTNTANVYAVTVDPRRTVSVREAVAITRGTQHIEGLSVTQDGRWLVFDSDRSGNADIYKMPVTGGDLVQLTNDPHDDFIPAWSRDGRQVVFHSWRNGNRDIYVVSADGVQLEQVTDDPQHDYYADWDPTGQRIVYYANPSNVGDVAMVARTANGWGPSEKLTQTGGAYPKWSPDGREILFMRGGSVWSIDVETRAERVLFTGRDLDVELGGDMADLAQIAQGGNPTSADIAAVYGVWAPDGRAAYFKGVDAFGRASIWEVPRQGGTARHVVMFDVGDRPSGRREFTTDGRRLYFTIDNRESDIWLMAVNTGR